MTLESPALIVVGVDGSPGAAAALVFALTEAARAGDSVEVVTASDVMAPALSHPRAYAGSSPLDRAALRQHAEEIQQQALQQVEIPMSVVVSTQLVEGAASPVLVEAARRARLLVVGSRSIGSLKAGVLGRSAGTARITRPAPSSSSRRPPAGVTSTRSSPSSRRRPRRLTTSDEASVVRRT